MGQEQYGNGQMSWPLSGGFLVEHGGYPNVGNPMNRRQGDYQDPLPI